MTNCPACGQDPFPLLAERPEGTFYVGPLEVGKKAVAADRFVIEGPSQGFYRVLLCDRADDPDSAAEFGYGVTPEEAWRYALGAAMGPVDAEYDDQALREFLHLK